MEISHVHGARVHTFLIFSPGTGTGKIPPRSGSLRIFITCPPVVSHICRNQFIVVFTVQVYRCLCNTDTTIIATIVIDSEVVERRPLIITIQFHGCHGNLIIIHNIVCPEGKIPVRKGDIPGDVVIRLAPQNEICDIISTSVNKCHFLNNEVVKVKSRCWGANLVVSICGPRETPGEPAGFHRHI